MSKKTDKHQPTEEELRASANVIRSLFLDGATKFGKELEKHNEDKKKFVHNHSFDVQGFKVFSNTKSNARKKLRSLAGNILMAPNLTREELKETVSNITSKLKKI